MTTLYSKKETCAVCGNKRTYDYVGSTSTMGASDLDGRPPEMRRSTIAFWIHACPSCKYVAPSISDVIDGAEEAVKSADYLQQLRSEEFPKLASLFLCYAQIQRHAQSFGQSGIACLHAAWACDDHGFEEQAVECREMASRDMRQALTLNQTFMEGFDEVILVDVLRRASQFDGAGIARIEAATRAGIGKLAWEMLKFQEKLIEKKDIECYTVDDIDEGTDS